MRQLRWILFFLFTFCGSGLFGGLVPEQSAQAADSAQAIPQWIWLSSKAEPNQWAFFRKEITLGGKVKSANIAVTCDNHMGLFINTQHVCSLDHWQHPAYENVTRSC